MTEFLGQTERPDRVTLEKMKPNLRLEAFAVFTTPADDATRKAFLKRLPTNLERITIHPDSSDPMLTRAIALQSDTDFSTLQTVFSEALETKLIRWLEIGLHGYGIIDKSVEYRPWLRNRYLKLEDFLKLERLEPEVRYHAPD